MTPRAAPLYVRVSAAPEVFGMSVATVYRRAKAGDLFGEVQP